MPVFRYEAMDASGQELRDSIEAINADDAVQKIRSKGLFLLQLRQDERNRVKITDRRSSARREYLLDELSRIAGASPRSIRRRRERRNREVDSILNEDATQFRKWRAAILGVFLLVLLCVATAAFFNRAGSSEPPPDPKAIQPLNVSQ